MSSSFYNNPSDALREARELVLIGHARARVRGDSDAALRLDRLATLLGYELEYATNRDQQLPFVRRRTDAPATATVGWYLDNDAALVALREINHTRPAPRVDRTLVGVSS